jgi:hypothetical protein
VQLARNTVKKFRWTPVVIVLVSMSFSLLSNAALGASENVIPDVTSDATHGNGQRKIAVSPDGTTYIIHTAPSNGTAAVVVSSSDAVGASWVRDAVLSRSGIRAGLGSLSVDAAGTLHAAWVDYENVGQVWYATRTGDVWSESVKISPGSTYAGFPVVVAGKGAVHVLWYAATPDSSYRHGALYEIRHTTRTSRGWTDPVLVSTGSEDSLNPSAVADQQGNVHSAWYQFDGRTYRVNYAMWDAKAWTVPDYMSPIAVNARQVSIDIAPDGTVYLVWSQFVDGVRGIALAHRAQDAWSDTEFLTTGPAADPVLATDSEGNVFVAWTSAGEIILRRLERGTWGAPEKIGFGASPTISSGESVSIAWTRPDGAVYEIAFFDISEIGTTRFVPMFIGVAALTVILAALILGRRRRA